MIKKIEPYLPPSDQIRELIIYGREDCHLCQDMMLALQRLQQQVSFDFKVVDIDSDPELAKRYGERIPVLMSPLINQEICHYFLDLAALDDYLGKFR
nr:glutaredoxin family protein [uncultured Nitrosomonas sp.]